jgi:hypothetical protein
MTTIDITRRSLIQKQPVKQKKTELPKLYVINLEPAIFSYEIGICPNCFIFMYENQIRSNAIVMDAHTCYNKLMKGEVCTITKPLTKDIAETYLQPIQTALIRYRNKHNLDNSITDINAIIREV